MRPWRLKRSPMGLGSPFLKCSMTMNSMLRPTLDLAGASSRGSVRLDQLEPVAERVVHEDAACSPRAARRSTTARGPPRRAARPRAMRGPPPASPGCAFRAGRKSAVDAQVDLEGALLSNHAAAARGEHRRLLRSPGMPSMPGVEGAGLGLAPGLASPAARDRPRFHRHGRSPQRRGRRTTQGQHTTPDTLRLTPAPWWRL